jgi:hypothetical protein
VTELNRYGTNGFVNTTWIFVPGSSLYLAVTTSEQDFADMDGTSMYLLTATADVLVAQGPADLVFTAEADDETLTTALHGMTTGAGPYLLSNSGGALPTGLSAATLYWIIVLTVNTYQLAASLADALAGTEVTFTTDGTGTHTLERANASSAAGSHLVPRGLPWLVDSRAGVKLSIVGETTGKATLSKVIPLR